LRVQKYNLFRNWQAFFSIFLRYFLENFIIHCITIN